MNAPTRIYTRSYVMHPVPKPTRMAPALQLAREYGDRQYQRGVTAGRRQVARLVMLLAIVAGVGWGLVIWRMVS